MQNRKINAGDVAQIANVSKTTVSRVINNNPHVKESVRLRVWEAAKQLNYSPKKVGANMTCALILPLLKGSTYYSTILDAVRTTLNKQNYSLEIVDINNTQMLSSNRIGGIITVYDLDIIPKELKRTLMSIDVPIITINNELENIPSISSEHALGIEMAVNLLIENGHRNIACAVVATEDSIEELNFTKRERIKGYKKAMEKNGIDYDKKMIFITSETKLIESVALALNRGATAIILAEEGYGVFIQYALALLNRKIPEEVSVITYEAPHISPYLKPTQTTIDQNVFSLGKLAAKRMISMIEGTDDLPVHRRLPNKLHLRDSVASCVQTEKTFG